MSTITKVGLWGAGLIFAWITVMALVMRFSDAAPAAVVILPGAGFIEAMPEGTAILSRSPFSLTVRDDAPDLAIRLYAAGAWLVLPAGLTGCLPLPKTARGTG